MIGSTGVGKSYLASALGQSACRRGLRVLYRRLPRLLEQLSLARADGSYARVLSKLAKADLLVIDDLGLGSPKEAERHDLLEVMEDRYGKLSTVVTSQLPVSKWHEWIVVKQLITSPEIRTQACALDDVYDARTHFVRCAADVVRVRLPRCDMYEHSVDAGRNTQAQFAGHSPNPHGVALAWRSVGVETTIFFALVRS